MSPRLSTVLIYRGLTAHSPSFIACLAYRSDAGHGRRVVVSAIYISFLLIFIVPEFTHALTADQHDSYRGWATGLFGGGQRQLPAGRGSVRTRVDAQRSVGPGRCGRGHHIGVIGVGGRRDRGQEFRLEASLSGTTYLITKKNYAARTKHSTKHRAWNISYYKKKTNPTEALPVPSWSPGPPKLAHTPGAPWHTQRRWPRRRVAIDRSGTPWKHLHVPQCPDSRLWLAGRAPAHAWCCCCAGCCCCCLCFVCRGRDPLKAAAEGQLSQGRAPAGRGQGAGLQDRLLPGHHGLWPLRRHARPRSQEPGSSVAP